MILLFGAGGQFGQELAAMARRGGAPLLGRTHAEADITDPDAVAAAIADAGPALIVNGAGFTDVDGAESDPDAAMRANAAGAAVLAEAAARAEVPLVHLSTDYVFDGSKARAYREDDAIAPLGAYGRSKAEGEALIRDRHSKHLILRTSWVYGVYGRNFLKTMMRLAREKDEIRVVADQRGAPTSTADLARAVLHIAPRLAAGTGPWGTFHFAGTGTTTWHGFASRVIECQAPVTGRRPLVTGIASAQYPTRARRPANSALDSTRFAHVFGLRAGSWEGEVDRVVRELLAAKVPA